MCNLPPKIGGGRHVEDYLAVLHTYVTSTMTRVCKKDGFSKSKGIVRNNCYAYSVGVLKMNGVPYKLQPGDLSTKKDFSLHTCKEVVQRTKEDLKVLGGEVIPFSKDCGPTKNKIALILAPGLDYHFLVHHTDVNFLITCHGETRESIATKFKVPVGHVQAKSTYRKGTSVYVKNADCWSHKRGTAFPPSLMDSDGKIIKDPRKSRFDYGLLNYTVFCAAFCVKKRDNMLAPVVKSSKSGDLNIKKYDHRFVGMKRVIKTIKNNLPI